MPRTTEVPSKVLDFDAEPACFLGETLAAADGHFTAEKFQHLLDDIFDAAVKDSEIEVVMFIRKGAQVALLGVADGQVLPDNIAEFKRLLMPLNLEL